MICVFVVIIVVVVDQNGGSDWSKAACLFTARGMQVNVGPHFFLPQTENI